MSINYWNQTIESKIREYQEGVDYSFDGEKYHAPTEMEKGRTTRTYHVNHPQLKKELRQILRKNVDIIVSLGFEKKAYISERNRGNDVNNYHCFSIDEFGNSVIFNNEKWNELPWISITQFDNEKQKREGFAKHYQASKSRYDERTKQVGKELTSIIPPHGVKCWSCYEVISDNDISQGRYKVENTRLDGGSGGKTFFRTFAHLKEHGCKGKNYDPSQRNNYQYCEGWIEDWEKKTQKTDHKYSCQDCLNKIRDEITGNLIWLETWDKQEQELIDKTQKIIAEIEKRLQELNEVGGYDNCGIRLCCAEHDKNHKGDNRQHESRDKKGLIAGSHSPSKVDDNPNLGENNNQIISTDFLTKLLKWMKKEEIAQISLDTNNHLVAEYDDN
jgi:hypothetical protein